MFSHYKAEESDSVCDMPWHRFSTSVTEASTAADAIRAANLNWRVVVDQSIVGSPQHPMLLREDVRDRGGVTRLVEVKPTYKPIQNLDVFTFFDAIVSSGVAVYDSVGILENGRWIWATVRIIGEIAITDRDLVAQFVLLVYKHGSPSPIVRCRPVRLAGRSVLHDGLLYPLIKTTTRDGLPRLEDSSEAAIEKIVTHFQSVADTFRAMVGIKMDGKSLHSYLEAVFPKARPDGRGSKYRDSVDRERAIQKCTRLFAEGAGNDLTDVRGSLWAAYSSVAAYVDYDETPLDNPVHVQEIWGSPLKSWAMAKATKLVATP